MTIINGVGDRGRVESLLDLENLVELTADGFGSVRSSTIDSIAARLRVTRGEQLWLAELDWRPGPIR